nr:MAG TPA: hypothetical protein [Caudoviricetes sp.]
MKCSRFVNICARHLCYNKYRKERVQDENS